MNKIPPCRSVPPFLLTFFPIFLLPLGMPIDSEIMDGFWHSRCLNDRIEVSNMMRLFAGGATTPWWWKLELNNPGWKLKICTPLIAILRYLEAKFNYSYFIFFCVMVLRFYTKNLKSFWPKIKAWRRFFRILISFWIRKINVTPSFFAQNHLKFFL